MQHLYRITRPDGTTKDFYAELSNGILFLSPDRPYWNSRVADKYGVTESIRKHNSYRKANETERKAAMRPGTMEDCSIIERIESPAEKEKRERDEQNAFLRKHGYAWKKHVEYVGGDYDETDDKEGSNYRWALHGKDGQKVDDVELLLAKLGFFGESGLAELEAEREADRLEKEAKAKVANELKIAKAEIEKYFRNTEGERPKAGGPEVIAINSLPTLCFKGDGFDIYGTGVEYLITESHIWKITNNGMDGDDWSANNYRTGGAGAIAVRFPRNERIIELMQNHMKAR